MPGATIIYRGVSGAPGLADGPVHRFRSGSSVDRQAGSPDDEAATLRAALTEASAQISDLIDGLSESDPEGAAILEFQIAFLEDDALSDPALERIAGGEPADSAFTAVIEEMAADYEASGDSYFAARATDLRDMGNRVCGLIRGEATQAVTLPAGGILLADDLSPSLFLASDWSEERAIALEGGSPTAHVAILARNRGVPMVVALGSVDAEDGTTALIDGNEGTLSLSPDAASIKAFAIRKQEAQSEGEANAAFLMQPAITADGQQVEVHINIGGPDDLIGLAPEMCDGIGLVRSEFLFHDRDHLPDEAEQTDAYRRILDWADGRPVTIRTLDAGGDKPIPGLTMVESNPFLGVRGIRLSLARPEIFEVQLRALVSAAPAGNLKIMVPMIALPDEIDRVRAMLQAIPGGSGIPLGMMIEVPAAAVTIDRFEADFFSIGSNDLTQYALAAARDISALAAYQDAGNLAVLRLCHMAIGHANSTNIPISLCGDAGGDPAVLPHLLEAGLRSVSVAPPLVGRTKRVISEWLPLKEEAR